MKSFREMAEKLIQKRRGQQANQPPMSPEMGRGLLRGGFGKIENKMMPMRQMQDKPNMTISGPNPMPGAMKKGGVVSSASKRADGCAKRGKTRA